MLDTCILHVGLWKTGSTSIQQYLLENRLVLQERGVIVPEAPGGKHNFLFSAFHHDPKSWPINCIDGRLTDVELARFHERELFRFERMVSAATGTKAVLSCEHLSELRSDSLQALRDYLRRFADRVTVVAYVRHPVAHAWSALQEQVKQGWETLEQNFSQPKLFIDIKAVITALVGVFGREDVVLREFSGAALRRGDVVTDFLATIGVASDDLLRLRNVRANQSLSHEALLIASALNEVAPRLDPRRGPAAYLPRICGVASKPPQEWVDSVSILAVGDLEYVQAEFGMTLRPPQFRDAACGVDAWRADTIAALAKELNSLELATVASQQSTNVRRQDAMQMARDLERVYASNSWKLTAPLRWLRSASTRWLLR